MTQREVRGDHPVLRAADGGDEDVPAPDDMDLMDGVDDDYDDPFADEEGENSTHDP